jgi:hypothetical protein
MIKSITRRLVLFAAVVIVAGSSLGVALPQLAQHASAAGCQSPALMFGRWKWCGYFYNKFEDSGTPVRLAGVPSSVNTAQDFINLVTADYLSFDTQKITEAVFIVRTMIGDPLPNPPCALGTCKTLSNAQLTDFANRVKGYASTNETGSQSFGPSGRIDWFKSDYMHCGMSNSYYQPTYHDIAPYVINSANTPECNNTGIKFDHIIFYNSSGAELWRIRRLCMNPLGTIKALAAPPASFALTSGITITSGGSPLPAGSFVEPGDQVSFSYNVNNSQAGTASGITCTLHSNNYSGYDTTAPTGGAPAGVTCRSTFGPGNTNLGTENIASAPNDNSLCRSLTVSPSSSSGGTSTASVCVFVASKPYFRAYGGDVSAGNPQSSACTTVTKAGIVSWTKGSAGAYAGASTQYAALALDTIYDFATSVGNGAGAAAPPTGLSFASTTASGPDNFGGMFGNGSLQCMPDYYASASGGTLPSPNLAIDPTGTYTENSPYTISGGLLTAPARIALYVNGDLTINNGITYPATWTSADPPLVMVVVKGNIYINQNVHQLDGLYVAQGGTIYTCTNGGVPYNPGSITNGTFNGPCNQKLVVHGAFVAQQIQLLRTNGSLKQSNATETATGGFQAETFDYSPSLWMALPPNVPTVSDYDSITSLPPIL